MDVENSKPICELQFNSLDSSRRVSSSPSKEPHVIILNADLTPNISNQKFNGIILCKMTQRKYVAEMSVAKSCLTVAGQATPSMEFPRQEYWSGLPFPSPGDLPDPGIEPPSPALAGKFFTTEPPGKPQRCGRPGIFFLLHGR